MVLSHLHLYGQLDYNVVMFYDEMQMEMGGT